MMAFYFRTFLIYPLVLHRCRLSLHSLYMHVVYICTCAPSTEVWPLIIRVTLGFLSVFIAVGLFPFCK